MNATQSKAEVYIMALNGLTKQEREAVFARLLQDERLRAEVEDILDSALVRERRKEPSRPFREYLVVRK